MTTLQNKIDFAVIVSAKNANPNGDPLNGNVPRTNYAGIGEMSDVSIKRKIRNRLLDMGQNIFVQSQDRRAEGDNYLSLKDRAEGCKDFKKAMNENKKDDAEKIACKEWIDVRTFGQVFAFSGNNNKNKGKNKKDEDTEDNNDASSSSVSIGIRGPVSIHPAFSVDTVNITSLQITKSVNGEIEDKKNPYKKSTDTMGMKHRVDFGLYVFYGSINCQLAEKTGFSKEDAELIKNVLTTLFENDCSSARPDGSMNVCEVIWWTHNSKSGEYPSAKVHGSLKISKKQGIKSPQSFEDYIVTIDEEKKLSDLKPMIWADGEWN